MFIKKKKNTKKKKGKKAEEKEKHSLARIEHDLRKQWETRYAFDVKYLPGADKTPLAKVERISDGAPYLIRGSRFHAAKIPKTLAGLSIVYPALVN